MEAIYQDFPVAKGQIRLLTVQRAPFKCSFQVAQLGDDVPPFTAVSYAWGDANPAAASRVPFHCDTRHKNASIPLSQTLTDLFQSLLQESPIVTVWVDAICINQADDAEKGIQVDQIGEVYSQAAQVVVWLGAATPTSTAAFRFMESKRGIPWPDGWDAFDKSELEDIEAVFLLLDRPWFRRLWVVQEVTLSSNVVVACGGDRIGFRDFEACIYAVWAFFEGLGDFRGDDEALLGLWSITSLLLVRTEFRERGAVSWERLLQAASHRLVTDSRDKIFAFRDLAAKGRPLPRTDYGADAHADKLYTDTAIALLCHGECLDLLALAGTARNQDSSLPSWVPDHRQFTWNEPFVLADGAGWSAGGPFRSSPTITPGLGFQLLTKQVDRIARTCPVFTSWDVLQQQAVMRKLEGWRADFRLPLSERAWLDILAASLTFGLDMDDRPTDEEEYRQYFDDWYEWLMSSKSQADLPRIKHNKFFRTIGPRVDNWKAFLSDQGYFGIGPPEVMVGDVLCLAPGCRLPLILRPAAADTTLISWCFLQGTMNGEAITAGDVLSQICLR